MEWTVGPILENVSTGLIELRVQSPESVVYGSRTEYADSFTLALHQFEPLCLYDNAETFDEEDAT